MDLTTLGTYIKNAIASKLASKQDELVSSVNIKTINNESILGEGNIEIQSSGGGLSKAEAIKLSLILG